MNRKPRQTSREDRPALPIFGEAREERADAARNRRKILEAAAQLIADHGVEGVSVEDVAIAAGVGVGTLYRRFGDRVGLAFALLDDQEREFQQAFLSGPPPLGPGAGPAERLEAFLHAYVDRLEHQGELILMAESGPGTRYQEGAYDAYHLHLTALLRLASPGDDSADYLAHALLAPLTAELYARQRNGGMGLERVKSGLSRLVQAVASGSR